MTCPRCSGARWVCEAHPDKKMGHDGCDGAGMPCKGCNRDNDPPEPPEGFEPFIPARSRQH